jgi:hypothetical protein
VLSVVSPGPPVRFASWKVMRRKVASR